MSINMGYSLGRPQGSLLAQRTVRQPFISGSAITTACDTPGYMTTSRARDNSGSLLDLAHDNAVAADVNNANLPSRIDE